MSSITIVPRKKVKPYLRTKRRLQRYSEKSVRAIAKVLRVPFAIDAVHAREILQRRWANADGEFRRFAEPSTRVACAPQRSPFASSRVWKAAA